MLVTAAPAILVAAAHEVFDVVAHPAVFDIILALEAVFVSDPPSPVFAVAHVATA